MTIKIPVSADFDPGQIEQQLKQFQQQLNGLGEQIAKANKVKFQPVTKATIDDMQKVVKQFESLKKISGDLNKRINATGQQGAGFFDLDWSKMYPDHSSMKRQMAKAYEYVSGSSFGGQSTTGQRPGIRHTAGHMAGNAAMAGLNAAGPAGRVVSGSISTGMSSGFGAGVAGLMGGILALGVSKIVGAAIEKLDEAEKNSIANDRLKRQLGDVNVSFHALQTSITEVAKRNHLLYSEAGQLASQFAKVGNISERQYKTLANEVGTGTGLSRAFGLDPSQGVGALAAFRGAKVTGNDQDTRRMALLIGETIGKADAFAKSGEVMDALSSYAVSQSRISLGGVNMGSYAGMFSSMVGSGISGLDPSNSAAILSRVISTLQSGGGAGEASQFFSSKISERNGLNPIAGAIWRENPMATAGQAFGGDTAVGRFLGKRGIKAPGGSGGSFYQETIDQLKRDYSDPYMQIEAASRHLGISRNQAAAMLDLEPNKMGELERRLGKGFDLKNLNGESIGTMSKLITGGDDTFTSVAGELRSRTGSGALSADERRRLDTAMSSGNRDDKLNTLLSLVAGRGQEQTQGKDIHDSKTALENLKVMMASQLIPLTQDMRTGILFLAGKGEKTGSEVLQDIAKRESELRASRIEGDGQSQKDLADKQYEKGLEVLMQAGGNGKIGHLQWYKDFQDKKAAGTLTDEDREDYLYQFRSRERSLGTHSMFDDGGLAAGELKKDRNRQKQQIDDETAKRLRAEEDRLSAEKKKIEEADKLRLKHEDQINATNRNTEQVAKLNETLSGEGATVSTASFSVPTAGSGGGSGGGRMGQLARNSDLQAAVAAAEREIGAPAGYLWAQMGVESNYNPGAVSSAGAMGLAQVMPGTLRNLEMRHGRKLNPYDPKDAVFIQKEVMRENHGRFGNWDDAARAYNGGWSPQRWGNPETSSYVPKIHNRMRQGMPMAEEAGKGGESGQRFILDAPPIEIIHKNERGERIAPAQSLAVNVRPATPFGTQRYA